jgi:hypothetical protein
MTRIPWEVLEARTVAPVAVAIPLLLAGLDLPSSMRQETLAMLVAAAVLVVGATVALSQPSLVRAVAVFGALQAPHFGLMVFEGFRDPQYLLVARPQPELWVPPGLVFVAVGLSDLAELGLVALAWRARRDASHDASDRFLAVAGVWSIAAAWLRWPPLLAALELDDYIGGLPIRVLPVRGIVQLAVGIVATAVALFRLRARRAWLAGVADGTVAGFRFVDAPEGGKLDALPLLSREGRARLLVRAELLLAADPQVRSAVARVGQVVA